MSGAITLFELLSERAAKRAESPAILSPGRDALSFAGLVEQIDRIGASLRAAGVRPNRDVAIVAPNGPEMAAAFLGVASHATAAPLNPRYEASEFEFYLSDLDTAAVLIDEGLDCAAGEVADRLGLPVIRMQRTEAAPAGVFELRGDEPGRTALDRAKSEDTALVLHTSGTTGRPKIVPLTHGNLCAAALQMGRTYELTPEDRFFCVMPLFHIQGITSLVATLAAGGSVVATSGFLQKEFFEWMDEFRPTWYTASPAVHQFVLAQAPAHEEALSRCPLRFIRSSAAPLPPQVMLDLEKTFGVPVLEGYGMTETCLHATSNPLPPGKRKPGAVGRPATAKIRVVDAAGNEVAPGTRGEILFRGPSVVKAYRAAPEVNERSFLDGWLRSGDEGYVDEDGDLRVTGRLKEMINRGGEKIAPREVDELLVQHPDVVQAVAFAVADAAMGEEVGVAVKLRAGASMSEEDARAWIGAKLAYFKIPRYVVFLDEIPKGPTGKLQRIGLAERLGLGVAQPESREEYAAPSSGLEDQLVSLWQDVLGADRVGVDDDFFALGGSSVLAAELFARIEAETGVALTMSALFETPTIRGLAERLERAGARRWLTLVRIQQGSSGRLPFFLLHAGDGHTLFFRKLAQLLGPDQPVYAFEPLGLDGSRPLLEDLREMASLYLREMRLVQPEGPYCLGGYCLGAFLSHEIAIQLQAQGQSVALLVNIDTDGHERTMNGIADHLRYHWQRFRTVSWRGVFPYVRERLGYRLTWLYRTQVSTRGKLVSRDEHVFGVNHRAGRRHQPGLFHGDLLFFKGQRNSRDPFRYWPQFISGQIEVHEAPGSQSGMFNSPAVEVVARHIRERLEKIAGDARSQDVGTAREADATVSAE